MIIVLIISAVAIIIVIAAVTIECEVIKLMLIFNQFDLLDNLSFKHLNSILGRGLGISLLNYRFRLLFLVI